MKWLVVSAVWCPQAEYGGDALEGRWGVVFPMLDGGAADEWCSGVKGGGNVEEGVGAKVLEGDVVEFEASVGGFHEIVGG